MSDDKPFTIVIFGASGDLTNRKLIPALYNNFRKRRLPDGLRIEKPFGRDLASAKALNRRVHEAFAEHQVYRIDHYLRFQKFDWASICKKFYKQSVNRLTSSIYS